MRTLSVILPAYNEERNLVRVVEEAVRFLERHTDRFEILLIDDGSTDGTGSVADALAKRFAELQVIRHPVNLGYGASLRDGFRASRHEWVFFTDADHQFRLHTLSELFPLQGTADIIVGYRRARQDPWGRLVLSWGYNQLMRLLFDVQVRDIDCAFKLIHRRVLDEVRIESQRFFVNTELLVKAQARRFRIVEQPVDHFPREFDRSSVNLWEVPRTLREVYRIWRAIRRPPAGDA